ncbi:hypothetical protein HCZ88_09375 [Limosilactobacillus fermentum]
MKIREALNSPMDMVQSGDAVLRSLQNTDFSITDIIVRESLQNALDASKPGGDHTFVEYNTGNFDTSRLNPEFEKISDNLDRAYTGEAEFLSISDRNTVGLNGEYDPSQPDKLAKSNFFKLVFGLGKNQEANGAGGSWGLGKTSYFRIGCGIVIYYTRIKAEQGYEERLIASLIEDPRSEKRLLTDGKRGIAWWGEQRGSNRDDFYPVTDHKQIEKFLDIFGLKPYGADDTGTMIIIPYLKEFEQTSSNPWGRNRERALATAIQRWYAPRILNAEYSEGTGNADLYCKVNGNLIGYPEVEQPFGLLRDLYTAALTGNASDDIKVEDIRLPRSGMKDNKTNAGRVAFVIKNLSDAVTSNGFTYRQYIEDVDDRTEESFKLVAFARKPGMIVRYDFDDKWSKGVKIADDQCLIAFFVPNSNGKIYEKYRTDEYDTLEQYLRFGEKADHADWFDQRDQQNITLVDRIKKETARALANAAGSDEDRQVSLVSEKLAHEYAGLLPPNNFGKAGRSRPKPPSDGGQKHEHASSITIKNTGMDEDGSLFIDFVARFKRSADVDIKISTQGKSAMSFKEWTKDLATLDFPVEIDKVDIDETEVNVAIASSRARFSLTNSNNERSEITGRLKLSLSSNEYQPELIIKQND